MKKGFTIIAVCIFLAACNNDSSSGINIQDSVLEKIDSTGEARVDSIQDATDSIQNKVEATFEKTDSANKANSDSIDKTKKN
jgi:predicted small secreted protein